MFRPWDDNGGPSQENNIVNSENTKKKRQILCKNCQQIIISVHQYCVGVMNSADVRPPVIETVSKMVGVNRNTVAKIIKSGPVTPKKRGNRKKKFSRLDNFECDLVRRTIYKFYTNKKLPTLDMILQDLKVNNDFPCQRSTLYELLRTQGFRYKKVNRRSVLLESSRYHVWRYKYITSLRKARREGRTVVYLDETCYDSHETVKKTWKDCSCQCISDLPPTRGKRIIIIHAGSKDGWVANGLLLSERQIEDASADFCDMNTALFEKWFKEQLLPNLAPNSVIVMDNAPYHSRLSIKTPNKSTPKKEILDFMRENNIPFPEPTPTIPVLLDSVKRAGIEKKYVIDELATANGFEVVRLPPYHCIFNPIEQVWSKVRQDIWANDCDPTNSDAVCQLIRAVTTNVTPELWNKHVGDAIKEENKYFRADRDIDKNIQNIIINTQSDSEDSDD